MKVEARIAGRVCVWSIVYAHGGAKMHLMGLPANKGMSEQVLNAWVSSKVLLCLYCLPLSWGDLLRAHWVE